MGKDAGQAGGFTGEDVQGDSVAGHGGGVDPGTLLAHGVVVEQVAGFKVVGAVEDEIGVFQKILAVIRRKVFDVGLDGDGGVDLLQLAVGGDGLGQRLGGIALVEQDLALQVAGLDVVAVDDADVAHAGAHQQRTEDRAGGSAADDDDARIRQFALALRADAGKEKLP